jgi:hypothetical protein
MLLTRKILVSFKGLPDLHKLGEDYLFIIKSVDLRLYLYFQNAFTAVPG